MNNIIFIYKKFDDYSILELNTINNPYHKNICADGIFKYGCIVYFLKNIKNIDTLLEPGCQISSLSAYICKKYNVQNVYLFDFDIVSGLNINLIQNTLFKLNDITTKINFKGGDFFSNVVNVHDNSIDLVFDGCSITHFCGNDSIKYSGLKSWKMSVDILEKKIKKGGHFIVTSDVIYDEDLNKTGSDKEFLYPNDIIQLFSEKFIIVDNPILSIDTIDNVLPYKLRVMCICFKKV